MEKAFNALGDDQKDAVKAFGEAADARAFLRRSVEKGDAVLLKASRGMKLEKILEGF